MRQKLAMASNPVRLGLMPPLTGVVHMYGQEIVRAGQIACDEVNRSGGVLGRPLELVIKDDGSLPKSAVAAAESLVTRHRCTALIGNLLSNSRIAVAYRVAEPHRVPLLNFSFYEGSILSRYFFHFAAVPNQQIDLMIPGMRNRFGPRMYFAGHSYEWPKGSIDAAKRILALHGGPAVGEEYFPIGGTERDLNQLLDRLEASGADVFVTYFAGVEQVQLLTLFSERGLKDRIAVAMGYFDEVLAGMMAPAAREGFYSCNTYFMSVDTPGNHNFLEALSRLPDVTGIWPHGNGVLTNFGEGAYLCVKAFAAAANRSGSLMTDDLVRGLESICLSGPQGEICMNPSIHHARVNTWLARSQADGTFAIVEHFGAIDPVLPGRYRHLQISGKTVLEDDIRLQSRIVEQMKEAVLLVEPREGDIVYANSGAGRMFGYGRDELLHKHFTTLALQFGSQPDKLNDSINSALNYLGSWESEAITRKKNGDRFWSAVSVQSFTHARYGEVWMMVFSDITERVIQSEQLRIAKDLAEEANRTKGIFLATVSHELRTPLNAILGMVSLLAKTQLNPRQQEYLAIFKRASESLLSIINDLLDSSKFERQDFALDLEPCNLAEIARDCISVLREKSREKGLDMSLVVTPEPFPRLRADGLRLRQIIMNLLGNAVKFTENGSITLTIVASAATSPAGPATDRKRVLISVRDTGIGIAREQQLKVFEPFTQADPSITRRSGGSGLGLYICRQLVQKMGGSIAIDSEPGKGSVFTVNLDLDVASADSEHGQTAGADVSDPEGVLSAARTRARVLVVDDNEDNRYLVRAMLADLPLAFINALNGQEALEKFKSDRFDLVLMDLQMPVMDGYTAIREIRSWERSVSRRPTPILALTAHVQSSDRSACLSAGADDFLPKPIDADGLVEKVKSLVPACC